MEKKRHLLDKESINPIGALKMVDGEEVLFFSKSEVETLIEPSKFSLILIGKFSHGIPHYKVMEQF